MAAALPRLARWVINNHRTPPCCARKVWVASSQTGLSYQNIARRSIVAGVFDKISRSPHGVAIGRKSEDGVEDGPGRLGPGRGWKVSCHIAVLTCGGMLILKPCMHKAPNVGFLVTASRRFYLHRCQAQRCRNYPYPPSGCCGL